MAAFRLSLLFLSLLLASICQGQLGHYLVSTHARSYDTPVGDIANISWSVGEPIVFNTDLTATSSASTGFGVAQAMQSYPTSPIQLLCPIATTVSNTSVLCGSLNTLELSFTISYAPNSTIQPDSIQWYFSESPVSSPNQLAKIVGAELPSYKPFFPGYYAVRLVFSSISCASPVYSSTVKVDNFSAQVTTPAILPSGSPASKLTATPDSRMGTSSLQWYAYVGDPLNQYLMVGGAISSELNVRYDTYYMAMATYPNGCRLSNVFAVSGHGRPLERAADARIEGNSIFIPLDPLAEGASLKVYPNPAASQFTIRYQSPNEIVSKMELYSNTGVLLREIEWNEGNSWDKSSKVSTEGLSAGIYFLKINEEGKSLTKKVMINK